MLMPKAQHQTLNMNARSKKMIIKSLVKHKVTRGKYVEHYIKKGYNALPSYFSKPLETDTLFTFIVGCGHSGTTLMAAKLSNHTDILGIGRETGVLSQGRHSLSSIKAILREWNYFAESYGQSCVLEKTPKHIYSYERVQKVLTNNKFIVMTRNPLDTIASLYKRFGDIEYCIDRWNYDNSKALELQNKKNVLFVKYEELTEEPEKVLKAALNFLGYTYNNSILEPKDTIYSKTSQKRNMKVREEQVSQSIKPNKDGWKKIFNKEQSIYIMSRVREVSSKLGYSA
ncbi:MAG: hypothetical protein CL809_17025 [Cobetia sp.]|nr:hypothetical protein [Cobetia sp.]HAR09881.1 hypothetical protein [Cobetia sp.]HBJ29351.1 hypothetical protein [Cobetia sp.]|tara:strand:- start:1146 stop:2000 length:855 start_codon:yes stop_codon:yes gene_type:complete